MDGWVVDVFNGDEIVEIQTRNYSKLKAKLNALLPDFQVRVVLPLAVERWIVRLNEAGQPISRRRSPKKARVEDAFYEIVNLGEWALKPNFILEICFVRDEVYWRNDGAGSWRRKGWSVAGRRLVEVTAKQTLQSRSDYLALLPEALPEEFTSSQLAKLRKIPARLAGKMLYSLRQMKLVERVGKNGKAYLYRRRIEE